MCRGAGRSHNKGELVNGNADGGETMSARKIVHYQVPLYERDMDELKYKTGKFYAKEALDDAVRFLLAASYEDLKRFVEEHKNG